MVKGRDRAKKVYNKDMGWVKVRARIIIIIMVRDKIYLTVSHD